MESFLPILNKQTENSSSIVARCFESLAKVYIVILGLDFSVSETIRGTEHLKL